MGCTWPWLAHRWQWFGNVLLDWRGGDSPRGAGLYQCTRCKRLSIGAMRSDSPTLGQC